MTIPDEIAAALAGELATSGLGRKDYQRGRADALVWAIDLIRSREWGDPTLEDILAEADPTQVARYMSESFGEVCPSCGVGCSTCFEAGKSHVQPVEDTIHLTRAELIDCIYNMTRLLVELRAEHDKALEALALLGY